MKILLLALEWPFPPRHGGAIATASLVSALAQLGDLTVFALDDHHDGSKVAVPGGTARRYGKSSRLPRTPATYLGSWLKGLPLAPYRNWNPDVQAWVDRFAGDFDLLVFDHLIPAVYLRKGMPPAILVEQNAEYSLWERAAKTHSQWLLRPLMRLEAFRMRAFEQRICRTVRQVVTLTQEDASLLAPLAPDTPFEVIPPCLMSDPLEGRNMPSPPSGKRFLFVGTLSWEPNADGLTWFIKAIWPKILARHPDASFDIVGRGLNTATAREWARVPGLRLHGFQEDLAPFYASARAVLAPLRFGSGFKLKVLEGMAWGVPVVTSTVGSEGFGRRDPSPFPICQTEQDWMIEIDRLLMDDDAWVVQSQNQRTRFILEFSFKARVDRIQSAIQASQVRHRFNGTDSRIP